MTYQRISRIDARFFNDRAMRVYEESDQGALYSFLERLPDRASDDEVEKELESCYDSIFGDDEEDLMDGDLEDQLDNLLSEGDKEDAKIPRHCIDDLEKRYVLLTKIDGRYLTDIASDDLGEIDRLKEVAYVRLNSLIHREGQGVAAITVFDRDADMDLYHVEMCLYRPREASRFEQAIKGVRA